jgi:hypothetical protein
MALLRGGFGGTREKGRARMGAFIWKMPEYVGEALAQGVAQALEHRPEASAVRAEIIAIDHDAHDVIRCASAAHMVLAGIDGAL